MRFESDIHWSEGLFLQPHHFQQLQRSVNLRIRNSRAFSLPYACGLIDLEIDSDALKNSRVVLKRFSAVMPNGKELSMPGNTVIRPLDISEELNSHNPDFMVYIALPVWSEFDANLAEDDERNKKQFTIVESSVRDENSGDNEIPFVRRRFNARLTTSLQDNSDMELLPLMRLIPRYQDGSETMIEIDRSYIPPFMLLSNDCPLLSMAVELNIQLRNRRDKIMHDLAGGSFSSENLSGANLYKVLQLQTINGYESRLSSLLSCGRLTPFDLYLELKSLLGELAALQPMRDISTTGEYNHFDCYGQFYDLMTHIRSLILAEGLSSYIKIDFEPLEGVHGSALQLKDEHLLAADDYYLALQCSGDIRRIIEAVENGDNFKLVNPASARLRVRGMKLNEMRYPPRFLPALPDTLYFKLDRAESRRIWSEICNERAMILDWADEIFPELKAFLFITVTSREGGKV